METARLETFSDGVFAIAATLLILDVRVSGEPLGHALVHAWPQYAAYALSFVTIGILWINHHTVFRQIDRVDRTFLMLNVVFLMVIAFVPFPTRLVAEHLGHQGARAAALLYGLTFTSLAIMYSAIWFYAALGRRLIAANADQRTISGISRSYLPGAPIYGTATLAAFVSPYLSVALYAAIALFYVLESSIFGREQNP